ncbi:MAG: sulfatase [bacterium]
MTALIIIKCFFVLFLLPLISLAVSAQDQLRPNIIIIFADDLGYGDLGCYGSELHKTPNIDKLATNGLRFTDFYATAPFCYPSRASLLTGSYPARIDMGTDENGYCVIFPGSSKGLNKNESTIATMLKKANYKTACIGKWHLGDQPEFNPLNYGFDYYFGIPYSNDTGSEFESKGVRHKIFEGLPPTPLLRNNNIIEAPVKQENITKRYTKESIKFIKRNKNKPFFLYLPHTMPHNPVHSSRKFKGRSINGGYGDAVEEIDWSTGEIMKLLKRLKIDNNTIVIFTSDNGAARAFGGSNGPLSGWKGSTLEGRMRVPCIIHWPSKIKDEIISDEIATLMDFLPTVAEINNLALPKFKIDGKSLLPILNGENILNYQVFYYYLRDELQAVRMGDWKLILELENPNNSCFKTREKSLNSGLYNLKTDIQETTDLSEQEKDIVKCIKAEAEKIIKKLGTKNFHGKEVREASYIENTGYLIRN